MTSVPDLSHNLERAEHWIREAARGGAALVALPENFCFMQDQEAGPSPVAQDLDGPVVQFLRDQAKASAIVLAGGSFPERIPGDTRVHNTSLAVDADGSVRGVYRKIHLFDVALPGATHRESRHVAPGSEVVVAETSRGKLGLSICYDVRFPELYRLLVERGARTLLVPSAFTVPTGRDHWEVLLRSRAIENQAFVIAAAQYGEHTSRRRSYGRSMVVDPWGVPLCTVPDGEGLGFADLDFDRLEKTRERLPALKHRRLQG
jgi:predicted amidohydrolase